MTAVPDPNPGYLLPDGTLHQGCIDGLIKACVKAATMPKDSHQRHFFEDLVRALEELLRHRALAKDREHQRP
jgi:hypothetical protein